MKCIECKGELKETTTTYNSRWGDYTVYNMLNDGCLSASKVGKQLG